MSQENCIFCKIVNGEIPCAKVFENDDILAFLDISPFSFGHTLVIPKKHYANTLEFDATLAEKLMLAIQKIAPAIMNATNADGFNVMQNNFAAAGQTVFHAHWHIIPRKDGDNMPLWEQNSYENPEKMKKMAENIANKL